jgi:hypothetical protein
MNNEKVERMNQISLRRNGIRASEIPSINIIGPKKANNYIIQIHECVVNNKYFT